MGLLLEGPSLAPSTKSKWLPLKKQSRTVTELLPLICGPWRGPGPHLPGRTTCHPHHLLRPQGLLSSPLALRPRRASPSAESSSHHISVAAPFCWWPQANALRRSPVGTAPGPFLPRKATVPVPAAHPTRWNCPVCLSSCLFSVPNWTAPHEGQGSGLIWSLPSSAPLQS